jgi:hypothetical protein
MVAVDMAIAASTAGAAWGGCGGDKNGLARRIYIPMPVYFQVKKKK